MGIELWLKPRKKKASSEGAADVLVQPEWAVRARDLRKNAVDHWVDRWERMEENYSFYRGNIFDDDEKQRAKDALKHLLEFTDLPTIIQSVVGRETVNKFRPALRGRDHSQAEEVKQILAQFGITDVLNDVVQAQAFTEMIRWFEQACDAEVEISDAFLDTFVCGMGVTNTYFDPLDGSEGKLKISEILPWMVAYDPASTKRNFKDAKHLFVFKWVTLDEANHLFPDRVDTLQNQSETTQFHLRPGKVKSKEDRPTYAPGQRYYNPETREVLLTEMQEMTRGDLWRFEDPETQEDRSVDLKTWNSLQKDWAENGIAKPEHERTKQWIWRRGWMAGEMALIDELEPNPIIELPTYNAITCYPAKSRVGVEWFGPVDLGRAPVKWGAKFRSLQLDILASGPKGATFVDSAAVKDMEAFRSEAARPDGIPELREGKNPRDHILFGPGPQFAPGLDRMGEQADSRTWSMMGLSRVGAGMIDDPRRAPFGTVNAIMSAGQTVFAMPFDSLKDHRKGQALRYMLFAREFVEPITVIRAVGADHAEAIMNVSLPREIGEETFLDWNRDLYDQMLQYDVIADDAPVSPNQMIALFEVMTQQGVFALLQQAGMAPPPEVVIEMFKAAGLPATMAQNWMNSLQGVLTPQQQESAVQLVLSQLSPETAAVVQAELQGPEGAVQ